MFREYPDVVGIEQMYEMLGSISTKTGYKMLENKIKLPVPLISEDDILSVQLMLHTPIV